MPTRAPLFPHPILLWTPCNHSDLPIESSIIYGKNTPVLLLKWLEHGARVFESWIPRLPWDLCISNCDKCDGIDSGLGAPTQPKKFHQVRVHVLRAWQAFFWGRQQLNRKLSSALLWNQEVYHRINMYSKSFTLN